MDYECRYKSIEAELLEYFSTRPPLEGAYLTLGGGTEHELRLPVKLLPVLERVYGDTPTALSAVQKVWESQFDSTQNEIKSQMRLTKILTQIIHD